MVLVFNNLVGSLGQLWIVVGVVLLLIPKTRKCGAAVLLSYALSLLIGNEWLKDWIARPRPCAVDDTVALIVKKPSSFSCPSVHTYLAFSSAMTIFHYYKKNGHAAYTNPQVADDHSALFAILWSIFAVVLSFILVFCTYKDDAVKSTSQK